MHGDKLFQSLHGFLLRSAAGRGNLLQLQIDGLHMTVKIAAAFLPLLLQVGKCRFQGCTRRELEIIVNTM